MGRHRIFVGKDVHKFSSAHMTVFPDGTKERLHGHNFNVTLAFDLHSTQLDALLDFGGVKRTLGVQCAEWDQRLLLGERCPQLTVLRHDAAECEFTLCGKRYVVPADEVLFLPLTNVVVETLAEAFAFELVRRLGDQLRREVVASMEVTISESNGQGGSYLWSWDAPVS